MAKKELINDHGYVMDTKFPNYLLMMATTAQHQTGDISAKEPSLCIIVGALEDNFIGAWCDGHCIGVQFPMATTRVLTFEEQINIERLPRNPF